MERSDFDAPALLMKLGGTANLPGYSNLGQAILHVMQQHSADRWQFGIITGTGMLSHQRIQELAATALFNQWASDRQAPDALGQNSRLDTTDGEGLPPA